MSDTTIIDHKPLAVLICSYCREDWDGGEYDRRPCPYCGAADGAIPLKSESDWFDLVGKRRAQRARIWIQGRMEEVDTRAPKM